MKEIYKEGNFTDYAGVERTFTVCACVETNPEGNEIMQYDEKEEDWIYTEVETRIRVGVSIVHPKDFELNNSDLGKAIASGRAKKEGKSVLEIYTKQQMPTRFAHTIAEYVVDDIQHNPGKYIKGYNELKERYLKRNVGSEQ